MQERSTCGREPEIGSQASASSEDATPAVTTGRSTSSTRRRGVDLAARASAKHAEVIDGWECTESIGDLGFKVVRTLERGGVQICVSCIDETTFPVSEKMIAFITAGRLT